MRIRMETLLGLVELARLAVISGFKFRGPYWTWRMHTAFGRGVPADRWAYYASILEYGRWVRRMRRG
jgi:hypothetical protein